MIKRRIAVVGAAFLLMCSTTSWAQYSIMPEKSAGKSAEKPKIEVVTPSKINTEAKYIALIKAQKRELRLKRNYLEFGGKLYLSQVMFDNWATESNNSINGRLEVNFKHIYKDDKFNWESTFNTAYQIGNVDKQFRKLDDRFELNLKASYQMHKSWYYSSSFNFKSQYSPGYKYPNDSVVISRFMAPANMILSLGLNYMPEKGNFSLTMAPVSGKMLFVLDQKLSDGGKFGVESGHRTKSEIGAYVRATWEKRFIKNMFRYRTIFTTFYNYKNTPNMGFENWLDVNIASIFSINMYCNVLYDRLASTPRNSSWQFNESIGFGISYTFKNKPKP